MSHTKFGNRGFLRVSAVAAVLLVSACGAQPGQDGPSPESSGSSTAGATAPPGSDQSAKASRPTALRVPSIGVDTSPLSLGLNKDHRLEVPPGDPGSPAGWYNQSPVPGKPGPSVFLGHVNDTEGGSGVFAELRTLKPGDTITVDRDDGSEVRFTVTKGQEYPKDHFPTAEVYGHTAGPELRLITCDGYDSSSGLFEDNYVVYAALDGDNG